MADKKWLPTALLAGMVLCSVTLGQSAAAATLTPISPAVIAGNLVTLTLNDTITAPQAALIGAVDLSVTFDHSLLSLVSVTDGSLLVNWDPPTFNPSNGLISISEGINGDDPAGPGTILQLRFNALAADPTTSTIVSIQTAPNAVGVSGEYQLAQLSKPVSITAAPITPPATVPEPGTVALLLAPMLAAAGLKRRDRC